MKRSGLLARKFELNHLKKINVGVDRALFDPLMISLTTD